MLSDFLGVVMWILGGFLMAAVTSEDESVSRFFVVALWPLALILVLILWGWDELKYRMRQRGKRKSQ